MRQKKVSILWRCPFCSCPSYRGFSMKEIPAGSCESVRHEEVCQLLLYLLYRVQMYEYKDLLSAWCFARNLLVLSCYYSSLRMTVFALWPILKNINLNIGQKWFVLRHDQPYWSVCSAIPSTPQFSMATPCFPPPQPQGCYSIMIEQPCSNPILFPNICLLVERSRSGGCSITLYENDSSLFCSVCDVRHKIHTLQRLINGGSE